MKGRIVIAIALASLMTATLEGQSPTAVRLQLAPGSQLTFQGTSTLHGFTCTTKDMQAYIDVDASYRTSSLATLAHPIVGVQVVIPVKSLACGGELEGNMLKTLNAARYPYIVYKLSTYDLVSGSASATGFAADTRGTLNIAGTENAITMRVDAARNGDGVVTASGEQALKMSEFGIKPPTFMLGTLRVGDQLKVKFTLKATSGVVASAIRELQTRDVAAAIGAMATDTQR